VEIKVKHSIAVLSNLLHDDLQALTKYPFGLIRIRDGTYGVRFAPHEQDEKSELETASKSSTGEL